MNEGAYGNGYSNGFRILDYYNTPLAQISFGDAESVWIMGVPFIEGEWFHIVLTYDHESIKLYENGELVVVIPETRDINWATYALDLYIGWAQWYFTGTIDNVAIFDYALNEQQIQQLYSESNNE